MHGLVDIAAIRMALLAFVAATGDGAAGHRLCAALLDAACAALAQAPAATFAAAGCAPGASARFAARLELDSLCAACAACARGRPERVRAPDPRPPAASPAPRWRRGEGSPRR